MNDLERGNGDLGACAQHGASMPFTGSCVIPGRS
jgi:hypothetical protein